jgi:hypothetical protein
VQTSGIDRWGATDVVRRLADDGLTCVPVGQGFASMSAPLKEILRLTLSRKRYGTAGTRDALDGRQPVGRMDPRGQREAGEGHGPPRRSTASVGRIYVEHASQAIIGYVPGSNRRKKAAGLKLWIDDWTSLLCATLDTGKWLFKFEVEAPKTDPRPEALQWRRRVVPGEEWPARNTLDDVALTELPNNPRLLTGGISEIADVIDVQDRINKTIADRLMTQDFGAFPQKWATGYPDDEDDTPFDVGRDRLVTTDVAETKFGQFDAAPLDPYSAAKREDVKDIASRTRTPAQYLLGEMANISGDTLKASESGLVSKVRQRMRSFSEGFEETMRLARSAAGLEVPAEGMETIWRNPEFRTEAEVTDAAVKQLAAGIRDQRSAREFVGLSQTEIAQMEARNETGGLDATLARVLQPLNPQPQMAVNRDSTSGSGTA